jgi:hypothetical protein
MEKVLGIMLFTILMVAGFGGGMATALLSKVNGGVWRRLLYTPSMVSNSIIEDCSCMCLHNL